MERLTKRDAENKAYWNGNNGVSYSDIKGNIYGNAITKLADYEDAEEQGKIYMLPIGLGKPCYVIEQCKCGLHWNCRKSKRADARRKATIIERETKDRMHHCYKIFERAFKVKYIDQVGKTVFATFEEAKQATERGL